MFRLNLLQGASALYPNPDYYDVIQYDNTTYISLPFYVELKQYGTILAGIVTIQTNLHPREGEKFAETSKFMNNHRVENPRISNILIGL